MSAVDADLYDTWDFDAHFTPHVPTYVVMCHEFIKDMTAEGLITAE